MKQIKVTQSPQGFMQVELAKNATRTRKNMVLVSGLSTQAEKTLMHENRKVLRRKAFALLVIGIMKGEIGESATKPELFAYLTDLGRLSPGDFLGKNGKPLKQATSYVDGTPMLPGKSLRRNSGFSEMVKGFVTEQGFEGIWETALKTAPHFKAQGYTEADRQKIEDEFAMLPLSRP